MNCAQEIPGRTVLLCIVLWCGRRIRSNVWNSPRNTPISQWTSGKRSFGVTKANLTSSVINSGLKLGEKFFPEDCKAWRRQYYSMGMFCVDRSGKFGQYQRYYNSRHKHWYSNKNLEEFPLKVGLEDNFILQQDNNPKYTARKTTAFFRASRIKLLNC